MTVVGRGHFAAVGFDLWTNNSTTAMISVYHTSNLLVGTYTLPQAPRSLGFVGATNLGGIGRIRFTAGYDTAHDSAIDNFLVGQSVEPEITANRWCRGRSVILHSSRFVLRSGGAGNSPASPIDPRHYVKMAYDKRSGGGGNCARVPKSASQFSPRHLRQLPSYLSAHCLH